MTANLLPPTLQKRASLYRLEQAVEKTKAEREAEEKRQREIPPEYKTEWDTCAHPITGPEYFIRHYCKIFDAEAAGWIPFDLWPVQVEVLELIRDQDQVIAFKARQLGLSWLFLAYALWLMLFKPIAVILIFSKRDDEAVYLLGKQRLRGMYLELPAWMRSKTVNDDAHFWLLPNGSNARAFPTSAGDSYTATLAIIDEADLVPDLGTLLGRVHPTVEAGGKIALISRSDKDRPVTRFKQIYVEARDNADSEWKAIFLPWYAHPGRTVEWYEKKKAEALRQTGSLDDVFEQYPATDVEALAGKSSDKRIPTVWLTQCYRPMRPLAVLPKGAPNFPGLHIYRLPRPGEIYVQGADTAEGNPTSDDSSITVLNKRTGEEVAAISGKYQPEMLGAIIHRLGVFYNDAAALIERNNHGHSVLLWLKMNSHILRLPGRDGKPGWVSSSLGKVTMYDKGTEAFKNGETTIHSFKAYIQLQSIVGATLRAPENMPDDVADSYVIAICAIVFQRTSFAEVW